jgi:hypothetical protein
MKVAARTRNAMLNAAAVNRYPSGVCPIAPTAMPTSAMIPLARKMYIAGL